MIQVDELGGYFIRQRPVATIIRHSFRWNSVPLVFGVQREINETRRGNSAPTFPPVRIMREIQTTCKIYERCVKITNEARVKNSRRIFIPRGSFRENPRNFSAKFPDGSFVIQRRIHLSCIYVCVRRLHSLTSRQLR